MVLSQDQSLEWLNGKLSYSNEIYPRHGVSTVLFGPSTRIWTAYSLQSGHPCPTYWPIAGQIAQDVPRPKNTYNLAHITLSIAK